MRAFQERRMCLGLGLLGLLGLTSGCGSDPNSKPAAPTQPQAEQDRERAAREKAYGKRSIPGK